MRTSHNKTATTQQTPKTDFASILSQQQQKAKIKLEKWLKNLKRVEYI